MKRVIMCGLFCSIVAGISGCTKPVEIIAHRGASYLAPENTMASVMLGWEKQANVEVDVHLSKDKRIVVIHDASTKHITGTDLKVRETTYPELRNLDYGSFKGREFAAERIPLLNDVLRTIPPERKLYVEIKCGKEILPFLNRLIIESGRSSQIVIIGFDIEVVTSAKELIDVPTYWLKGTDKIKETNQWIPHDPKLVQIVRDRGLDGLDVHYAGVTKEFVDAVKAAGQKLYVWTVDDPDEAKRLIELGVSGITTNRPEWLREQIKD
jgi:glycerophosphoryl diester phosphodiesterase